MAAHRKYQWEDWFGKPSTKLDRGIHYHCSQSNMYNMIRNAACRYKVRVNITDHGDSMTIRIRTVNAIPYTNPPAITDQHSPALA